MVEVKIVESKIVGKEEGGVFDKWKVKIKIDDRWEIDIDEYNKKFHYGNIDDADDDFFERKKRADKLYDEIYGSFPGFTHEQNEVEYRKNDRINPGLREKIKRLEEKKMDDIINGPANISRQWDFGDFKGPLSGSQLGRSPDSGIANAKTVIEFNNKLWENNIDRWKRIISLKFELKKQKDETGQKPGEKYNDEWEKNRENKEELDKLVNSAIQEVEEKLRRQVPAVSSTDLDIPNWKEILRLAISKDDINKTKNEVLSNIEKKSEAKKNKDKNKEPLSNEELKNFARDAVYEIDTERNKDEGTDLFVDAEELEKNNPNWKKKIMDAAKAGNEKEVKHIRLKVLVDLKFRKAEKAKAQKGKDQATQAASLTKSVTDFVNSKVEELNDEQLAEAMKLFQQWEGDQKVEKLRDKNQSFEDKLIENNPELYKQTIIDALVGRINDYEVNLDDLSEETKQLVSGEIIQVSEIKEIKDKALKEIAEKGAKNKWTSFFKKANDLLAKAKKNFTEQVKRDLKKVQEQMKDFKSGTNSYLSSIYNDNKSKAERWEKDFNSISNGEKTDSPNKTPWGIIVPVSLAVVALIGIVAVMVVRKRKQSKIKK